MSQPSQSASQPKYIWFNGTLVPWQDAQVHVMSHALHYGSSVFEGVRAYDTPKGTCIFRLQEHTRRLFDSAKIYWMDVPYSESDVNEACRTVVRENGLKSGYLRPLAFVGNVGLGLHPPLDAKADLMVAALPWGAYLGEEGLKNGVDVCVTSWNRLAPNTIPTGAKAGGNYLSSQLISREAKRNGFAEGLALDVNGYLSEGAGENLFLVKNGVLFTPPATAAILPGITRDTIMTLARDLGYEVREQALPREALYVADEIFMTGTAAEVTPVRSVDRMKVGAGSRGPVTEQLQNAVFGLAIEQAEEGPPTKLTYNGTDPLQRWESALFDRTLCIMEKKRSELTYLCDLLPTKGLKSSVFRTTEFSLLYTLCQRQQG